MAVTSTITTITQPIKNDNEYFKIKEQKDDKIDKDENYFEPLANFLIYLSMKITYQLFVDLSR